MRALRSLLVLGCLGLATTADAVLAPTKGSQLVTLGAGGACAIPGHPNAAGFNLRVGGDGALTPFTVPPKQILVLTDVVASTSFQPPGEVFFVNLLVGNAATSNLLTGSLETAPASGAFSVTYAPQNGMVVKSGSTLCIEISDLDHPTAFVGALSFAHGFLAPDK
jgi:hypothetical protein